MFCEEPMSEVFLQDFVVGHLNDDGVTTSVWIALNDLMAEGG